MATAMKAAKNAARTTQRARRIRAGQEGNILALNASERALVIDLIERIERYEAGQTQEGE